MDRRSWALLAAFVAALIYGLNFTIAKAAMPAYVQPYGFILLRVSFGVIFFWSVSFFGPKEKIDRKDFPRIGLAALFGVAINMLAFFKGLSYSTPISASIIMVTSPVMVMLFSWLLRGEKLTTRKIAGVFLGLIGTLLVILQGKTEVGSVGNHVVFGNFLIFVNASSYALYLVIVRKLTQKYHPFTFIKWFYLAGLILVLPFGIHEVLAMQLDKIPFAIWLNIGYVLFFATCCTYLFNLFAVRTLSATTVGVFIYLQPLVAGIHAVLAGSDTLNEMKIISAAIIFSGVYLVTKPNKLLESR
ncbi:MAG: EamA family transporter [Flavobacteriales bacterium CG_4_9_14_3_um_filter_40_17]|nr:MAG: EamA family transporter [Flavobacteriales bacterium CG_4_9_14_3_um_filter_40_17]